MSINRDNFEEHLFKASEKHAYPFQEDDWDVLEGLLEKKKKRRAFIFWLNGLGLFLVASCFAAYFAVQSYHQQEAEEICAAEEKAAEQMLVHSNDTTTHTYTLENKTHKTLLVNDNQLEENNAFVNNENKSNKASQNNSTIAGDRANSSFYIGSSDAAYIPEKIVKTDWEIPDPSAENESIQINDIESSAVEIKIQQQDSLLAQVDSASSKIDSFAPNPKIDTNTAVASAPSKENPKDTTKFSRVSVMFAVAPDLSFTQLVDVTKLQLSAFVGGEINITRNFSTLLGVAYSNKSYTARGSDYTPGKPKFWTGGVKPREVSASCDILDLSLALRYYHTFGTLTKTRFFAEAGSSSYLMMKEHYDFIYTNPNPALVQQWNVHSGIVYSFSVLNFGLGVERKIKDHWYIQTNPKFQMPLSALGWGSVKFSSAGLNMTLKYSF